MAVAMRAVELVRTLRSQAGLRTRQPIATLWLALPGGDMAEREALLVARRRRGQRQGHRADRRRIGAGRAPGQGPPATRRQAPRGEDPRGDGRGPRRALRAAARRLGRARRRDARRRRGRDPGLAEARHRGGPRPGPGRGHRHAADTRAARRRRCPGAPAGDPGSAPGSRASPSTTGSPCGSGHVPAEVAVHLGGVATETLAELATGELPADVPHRATVELDGGPVLDRVAPAPGRRVG